MDRIKQGPAIPVLFALIWLVSSACGSTGVVGPADEARAPVSSVESDEVTTIPDDETGSQEAETVGLGPEEEAQTADQVDGQTPEEVDGQTQEEAESSETLTGDYDLLLTGPERAEETEAGCLETTFRAVNVGGQADTYTFTTDVGTIAPELANMDPGQEELIVVSFCDKGIEAFAVRAFSEGRGDLIGHIAVP